MTSTSVLGLGVAGLGMGATLMVRGILDHPGVRVVAGAARTAAVRERFALDLEARGYASVEAMCADPSVDVVFVATPHEFHREHAVLAAEHGKHVIVEKPMALTLDDCDAMISAAERNGVKLIVGPTMSFAPAIRAMRQIIAQNELGPLRMVNTWESNDFLYRARRSEELDTLLGGGVIYNQAPHQVDIVRFLTGGRVLSVRSAIGTWDKDRPTEGSYQVFLQCADGASAVIIYTGYDGFDSSEFQTWIEPGRRKSDGAYGQARRALHEDGKGASEGELKRTLFSWGGQAWANAPRSTDQQHFGITVAHCERGDLRPWENGVAVYREQGRIVQPVPTSQGAPIRAEVIDELCEAIRTDDTPAHDGRWGKATMEVCLAIYQSAREQREISLEHQVTLKE
ncbi:MAG: Gfo/Idh/MocA family oxidoreductase [Chloroflexota bacterium]